MGKVKKKIKKVNPLYKRVDEVPENKRDFVDAVLETIINKIKEGEDLVIKKNYNFSDLAGTLKLPKNFDSVKWQKKIRSEWDK